MERIGDMPLLLLFVFRFVRLLLSGHQAIAIENAALRMQIAAFQRKRKRPLLTSRHAHRRIAMIANICNRFVLERYLAQPLDHGHAQL
jgi:hypothetical protein